MGQALDFLNKHTDSYDDSVDKIAEFRNDNSVTTCEDSTRNTEPEIAWYKRSSKDRSYTIGSPYDGMHIIKKGIEYRLEQLSDIRAKRNGYSYRAFPVKVGNSFLVMERQLKSSITKGTIKLKMKIGKIIG